LKKRRDYKKVPCRAGGEVAEQGRRTPLFLHVAIDGFEDNIV